MFKKISIGFYLYTLLIVSTSFVIASKEKAIRPTLKAQIVNWLKWDSIYYLVVKEGLFNDANSEYEFKTDCAWQQDFFTNNIMVFVGIGCRGKEIIGEPYIVKIKPHDSLIDNLYLSKPICDTIKGIVYREPNRIMNGGFTDKERQQLTGTVFKIGYKYMPYWYYPTKCDTVWSNDLVITKDLPIKDEK